jgi:phage terminase large subunit-like protein
MRLVHDRVLIGMGSGNAKTELTAHIGVDELLGPLAPVSPSIVLSAASWDNASRLFNAARLAIAGEEGHRGPLYPYFKEGEHLLEDKILLPHREGRLYRVAAVAGTNEGGLPSSHLGDELHEWEGRRERVYVVLGKSLKKRQVLRPLGLRGSLQIGISTAGAEKDSLLGRLYNYGVAVARGEIVDPGFLFLWWEADPGWDLDVEEQLIQSILQANPAAGEFLPIETLIESFTALNAVGKRYEYERYHGNRWVASPRKWIRDDEWDARRAPKLPNAFDDHPGWPEKGTPVVLAFDGSYNRDTSAITGCTLDGYTFEVRVWDPKEDRRPVDRGEVSAEIDAAMERWTVRKLRPDPPGWIETIEDWEAKYGAAVERFFTNDYADMAPAVTRLKAAVLDPDSTFSHDGSATVARHVGNARAKDTKWGQVIEKERPDSPDSIDGAVTSVMAFDGAVSPGEEPPVWRAL